MCCSEGNWHLNGRKCFLEERRSSVVWCEALQLSQGFHTFNKLLNSKMIPRRNRVWRDHSKGIFGFLQIMCTCYREEKEMRQTTVTSEAKSKYLRCCWPSVLQILRDCLEWLMVLSEMSACGKFTSDFMQLVSQRTPITFLISSAVSFPASIRLVIEFSSEKMSQRWHSTLWLKSSGSPERSFLSWVTKSLGPNTCRNQNWQEWLHQTAD